MSKGRAEMSRVLICGFLTSIGAACLIYPVVANAGCNACAQKSRIILFWYFANVFASEGVVSPTVMFVTTFAGWSVIGVIYWESQFAL